MKRKSQVNARLKLHRITDHFEVGNMNDNWHRLLELALKDLLSKYTQYTQSQSFLDAS